MYFIIFILLCRELTLQKGDIVYIHRQVDGNWFEGEHHGRAGIFPTTYVEVNFFKFDHVKSKPCDTVLYLFSLSFIDSASFREADTYKVSHYTSVGLR